MRVHELSPIVHLRKRSESLYEGDLTVDRGY
jgi:hypothetical protein